MSIVSGNFSDSMLNEGSFLSQSEKPIHQTVLIALRSLAHIEEAFKKASFLPEEVIPFSEGARVLSIIDVGLGKYELLNVLKKPFPGLDHVVNEVENYTASRRIFTDTSIKALTGIIKELEQQKEGESGDALEATNYCLEKLENIMRDWGGLFLNSEDIVTWQTHLDYLPMIHSLLKSLELVREKINCIYSIDYPNKEASLKNLRECLNNLNYFFKRSISHLNSEEWESLLGQAQFPEYLEILENEINEAQKDTISPFNFLKIRELGKSTSFPKFRETNLENLRMNKRFTLSPLMADPLSAESRESALILCALHKKVTSKKLKDLDSWKRSEYSVNHERLNEISESRSYLKGFFKYLEDVEERLDDPTFNIQEYQRQRFAATRVNL